MSDTEHLSTRVELPASAEEVFAWHLRPGALERLIPPWEEARVFSSDGVRDGGRTVIEVVIGPTHARWVAQHRDVVPGVGFTDEQVEGPFKTFVHRHRLEPISAQRCVLVEDVEYRLPLGSLGRLAGGVVARRLERMFAYRHAVLANDFRRRAELGAPTPRKIALTGASGMIGRALSALLTSYGHEVVPLVRRAAQAGEIAWDPDAFTIEHDRLVGVDAVVHLAGESVGDGRWSEAKKRRIMGSRVHGTRLVAETLAALRGGPRVLVSASAIGYYGSAAAPLDETAPVGSGFLAEVCRAWEAAAEPARQAGLRVVHPRIGIVLTPEGGALPPMVAAFKTGLGGRIGAGDQGMSWIAIDDVVAALHAMVVRDELGGPVNLTAPEPLDQASFARVLGEVLGRPSIMPLPATVVRLALGERGERLLLEGAIVEPARLVAAGHRFGYPQLAGALRHLLGTERESVAA